MAEPILGQALALQSEFRPDTSQVLTRAVDKIGNVTLKKQLAEAKAEEAKAKRLQEIMGAVKLDGAKVNRHFLPEAQRRYAEGIASLQESALKGDIMGVNAKKGQLEMEFANMAKQSDAMDNFLSLKKQGFYIAPEIEAAFSMPKAEGQAYLKKVYEQKPELRGIVDVNEYGDYVFNPIKDLDLQADFRDVVTKNEWLLKPTGTKVIDQTTKDQLEVYKIPKANIQEFALLKSQDPEIKANIILKDKAGFSAYVNQVKTANPNATPEQVENTALVAYIGDKLEKINEKTIKSNIPQGKGGLDFNVGGGYKFGNNIFNPTLADPSQNLGAYQKAGVLSENYIETFNKQSPEKQQEAIARIRSRAGDLLSISGPNKGGYSLLNEQGDKVYLDNIDFVYVPKAAEGKGGQWMVKGVSRSTDALNDVQEKIEFIPINEKTYGNVISIYPQMTNDDIVKMFNQRMKDGNIRNDVFALSTSKGRQPQRQGATLSKSTSTPASETQPKTTIKASDIAAKAKAAGYTDSEYRKLLKDKGVKII